MTSTIPTAAPSNKNSLGEDPFESWQRIQRSKPVSQFTSRERDFINESLNSKPDPNLTGTKVTYVKPEGEDDFSMYSKDDDEEFEGASTSTETNPQRKQRFKKLAKRLYPAKVFGGAKAVGGAFRHPMVTTRKVNRFMRRQGGRRVGATSSLADSLPPLTRSATMNDLRTERKKENDSPVPDEESYDETLIPQPRGEIWRCTSTISTSALPSHLSCPTVKMKCDQSVVPSPKTILTIGSASPISIRGGKNMGLRSPVRGRSPLLTRDAETADDAASIIRVEPLEQRTRGSEMIDQINEQIREWSLSGDSANSDDTRSTTPIPRSTAREPPSTTPLTYDNLRRHQKKESKDSARLHTPGREFTSAELKWLEYVVNELYALIVDKALDTKSGVQYRNTFAWRFQSDTSTEFDQQIGCLFQPEGKKFKIKNFVNDFDFRGALLEKLRQEPSHRQMGMKWSEISFIERRFKIELSYALSDDESD